MTPRRNTILKEVARFLGYGLLFAVLAWGVAHRAGYLLRVEPRMGWTGETSPVAPGDGTGRGLLSHDFPAGAEVRNVILLLADGLGFSQITAARSELGGLGRRLSFERMPITGVLMTHDSESIITDSAASATALATGFKTAAGRLGMGPDEEILKTLAEAAVERGLAVGAVTDTYLWDATPSAFLTHVAWRRNYPEVAAQMARSPAEILFGEVSWTAASEDSDAPQAMLAGFRDAGYTVAREWADVESTGPAAKLAGIFDAGAIADPERAPSLPQLADFALERLARHPGGFFLLVETEETDTASHRQQFRRLVRGVATIATIADRALDFAREDGSTLVLMTSDHETGGLTLVSGHYGDKLGVRWTTRNHGGGVVPIYAYGPGAERLSGTRDNTEVAVILAELLGLRLN